jgi:transcriptional regulator with XRE-family HTH domain
MKQNNKIKDDNEPNLIDVHVGKRIRLRRNILHVTQQQLAEMLGLTFQQVQKYEKGLNRVGASRLWDISRVLDVPMNFFFEDMDELSAARSPRMLSRSFTERGYLHEDRPVIDNDPMKRAETLELVRAYYKIPNRAIAKKLFDTIVLLSKSTYNLPDSDEEDDDE